MAEKVRFFDGKKFMWDSEEYADKKKAEDVKKQYSENGFEVQVVTKEGEQLVNRLQVDKEAGRIYRIFE